MKQRLQLCMLLVTLLFSLRAYPVNGQQPVVEAVLFYSPTCGHCEQVIQNDLPPLQNQHGDQLRIYMVDVSQNEGSNLYQAVIAELNVADDRIGVPTMIVGDAHLVGSSEIPEKLPGLIENGLQGGGVSIPQVATLADLPGSALASIFSTGEEGSGQGQIEPQDEGPLWLVRFNRDRAANTIAVIVLLAMVISLGWALFALLRSGEPSQKRHRKRPPSQRDRAAGARLATARAKSWPAWIIPALALVGLGAAAYLSYVEITKDTALCGPVGDCNTVQQSEYARLFGWLPVGVLGAVGYIGILGAWALRAYGPERWRSLAAIAIWIMAFFGVLFSVYLTFLEPFVIGATCMWCITSAIVITLILLASTQPAREYLQAGAD